MVKHINKLEQKCYPEKEMVRDYLLRLYREKKLQEIY